MGGVEKRTLRLMKAILDYTDNIKIVLVLNESKGELLPFIDQRIAVHSLDSSSFNKPLILIRLGKFISKTAPDIVVTGFGQLAIAVVIARGLYKHKFKIISIQAQPIHLVNAPIIKNFTRLIGAKIFFPYLDKIVTVSKGIENNIIEVSKKIGVKTETIYDPVIEPDIFQKAFEDNNHPFFNDNNLVVINVARLAKEKDHPTLIKAFAIVKEKYIRKNVKLIILGDGDYRISLERLIDNLDLREDVSLPGFVENPYSFMQKSSVFVLSSLWEGLGNSLIEAMALGKSIVSTNCEYGPAEILNTENIGTLVPVGDVKAMASAILKKLNTADDPEPLTQRANDFTVEKAVAKYINLFSSLHHAGGCYVQ